ncbi:MAG: UDP-N-acetylglucosamine 1-carboxyvinyltransferase [Oscillospiraceae bacterium]|jgi:UDP-N-acetylglucosamine 1-carboxyvinyltransferase|nr:UDP-N-acetylglucosamine 1-carboxyvinyltransferase [Oscillospiraceae bacterium]
MAAFVIAGGKRLEGEHILQGAKNSALPILAATVASGGECVVHGCPRLSDVDATLNILRHLGCGVRQEGHTVTVDASTLCHGAIPGILMHEMRSSIVFLGPLLAALGYAELTAPGGCEIGLRPIGLHLDAMRALGVELHNDAGRLSFSAGQGLRGARFSLSFPSVGATENLMIAAARAKGVTVLSNAAREPEILDLARFLNACGARVTGAGGGTVVIEGVARLHGAEHTVIPDRIAAVTFLTAAAVTGGELLLRKAVPEHMDAVLATLEQAGCRLRRLPEGILLRAPQRLRHLPSLRTMPYPGFPTDAQAGMMALAGIAAGTTIVTETIFENRFRHVAELCRMGANIRVEDRVAVVEGVARLHGAEVDACDLRAGAALSVAGLAAEGTTRVRDIRHIERGCERLETALSALGASIYKEEEAESNEQTDSAGSAAERN